MTQLPTPALDDAVPWVRTHLGDLVDDEVRASRTHTGGQTAADAAMAAFDVAGYAGRRNQVLPASARGASALSPFIRHGLLPLPRVWDEVAGGPAKDVRKYRDELLWQEYSRHLYARVGRDLGRPLRAEPLRRPSAPGDPWQAVDGMACMDFLVGSLERDGWLVNQTRMWAASHWSVRHGADWREGEDAFFRHLLDGSRAANRTGWQWTIGSGNGKPYGFSRWQVSKRAPELCRSCPLSSSCPIEAWPDAPDRLAGVDDEPAGLRADPAADLTAGPLSPAGEAEPRAVWLTAESLGDEDPALAAHPDLPVVFVFDEALLRELRLSAKRLVFLTQTLADLAERRDVEVHRGDPAEVVADRAVAVTWAPVPGFASRAGRAGPAVQHPWPWLVRPHDGSARSFSAWRKAARR